MECIERRVVRESFCHHQRRQSPEKCQSPSAIRHHDQPKQLVRGIRTDRRPDLVRWQWGRHSGVLPRAAVAQAHQLLHRVVGDSRLSGRCTRHTVCAAGIGGPAAQSVRLSADADDDNDAGRDIDILLSRGFG